MLFSNVDWTLAGAVVITGIVVVFFMLALLWFCVILIGKLVPMVSKKQQEQKPAAPTPIQATVRPKLNSEIVAAITGAVSTTTNKNFKIKSISLKGDNTPLWTSDN